VERDPGLEMLGHLLEASHDLAPDDLVAVVTRAGKAVDAEDVAVYLVDYEQTLLVPLPDGTDPTTRCGCGAAGWPRWSLNCS